MPGHYGYAGAPHRVGVVAGRDPDPARGRDRAGGARSGKHGQVAVAIMGEGSSNQGDVHEALNFAAIHKLPFVFMVENNGYAITVPAEKELSRQGRRGPRVRATGCRASSSTGRTCSPATRPAREAVDRARSGGGPTLIEAKVTRLTAHSARTTSRRSTGRPTTSRRAARTTRCRSSATQLRDARRADDEIEAALDGRDRRARRGRDRLRRGPSPTRTRATAARPRLRRALAGRDAAAVAPGATGRRAAARCDAAAASPLMPVRTFIEAIRDGMAEEMRRDESVVVLGEDVGKKGGVFLATDGLWGEFGDDRVIDTPLTESMIVGASIGAAINGLRPVAEIQFADFIHPAFNQIVSEAARMRYRTNGGFAVPMVDPGAVRRRRPRRAVPLAVGRGVLHPRAGAQGRDPVDAVRREGPAADRDPRRRPGAVLRAQEDVPLASAARCPTATTRCRSGAAADPPDRAARSRVIAYGLMVAVRPRGRRAGRGGGDRRRGRRPAVAPAARPGHDAVVGAQDRQVPRRLRGQPVRRLRGGDRGDRRRGGVRLPRRPGDADRRPRRARACPYNHALEDWFMLSPAKIADAIRKLAAY